MTDDSRPTVPLLYRLVADRSGQSETLGVVILLGIAVVGTAVIVTFGSAAMETTQTTAQLQRTEHTMTLFDSRVALVALGGASMQTVDLAGTSAGSYSVEEKAGTIKVVHYNYSGHDQKEVLLKETMGAVVYENGGTEIAYQGGGVWRKGPRGQTMVSPPEFHYRKETLTLPIIKVRGEGSVTGDASVTVKSVTRAHRIYPNATNDSAADDPSGIGAPYGNVDGSGGDETPTEPYGNPVVNGSVWVYVQSDYYKAWAEFFRTRSNSNVKVWDGNQTTGVELISSGKVGDFGMPASGNSIAVRGMGTGHPITNFSITLTPDDLDHANFANLMWSMTVSEGNTQYEIHFRDGAKACTGGGGGGPGGPLKDSQAADVYVYFDRNDSDAKYQGWYADDAASITCEDYDDDGDKENVLRFNMTGDTQMTYQPISDGTLNEFSTSGESLRTPVKWDQHSSSVSWEPIWFNSSDPSTTTVNNTTNHYLSQFGSTFQLGVQDKGGNRVNEDASSGTLIYNGPSKIYITYLHITENKVRVVF